MSFLRQSTSQVIQMGPFSDSTDGVTPETGLTIAQSDRLISKNGGSFVQSTTTGNATHDTNGWYSTTLSAADTDTVGILILQVTVSGSVPVWHTYQVVEEAVYDALYAASAPGYLQPTTAGNTLDVSPAGNAGIDWSNIESPTTTVTFPGTTVGTVTTNTDMRGTDSALLAASAPANFGDLAITSSTGLVSVGTNNDKNNYSISGTITTLDGLNNFNPASDPVATVTTLTGHTPQSGDSFPRLGAPAGASISADIASVKNDTGTLLKAQIQELGILKGQPYNNFQFLMVLDSDGKTPAPGLTVSGLRLVDNGAFVAVDGAITEVSNGYYRFNATANDTNGDTITWRFTAATADDTAVTFKTVQ